MHATIRRYEAVDQTRINDIVKKVDETLVPRLSRLPGFGGYHAIDTGKGVLSSAPRCVSGRLAGVNPGRAASRRR
jgi:hypothetical protein